MSDRTDDWLCRKAERERETRLRLAKRLKDRKKRIAALEALRDDCLAIFDLIDQCQLYGCADRVRERIEAARRKAREV